MQQNIPFSPKKKHSQQCEIEHQKKKKKLIWVGYQNNQISGRYVTDTRPRYCRLPGSTLSSRRLSLEIIWGEEIGANFASKFNRDRPSATKKAWNCARWKSERRFRRCRRRGFARREARTDPEFRDVRWRHPTIPISGHACAIFHYKELLLMAASGREKYSDLSSFCFHIIVVQYVGFL